MDGSDDDVDSEPDEEETEIMKKFMHVNDKSFEEMELPPKVVTATQKAWNGFVSVFEKREAAADAIYGAFFDAAPNLQGMLPGGSCHSFFLREQTCIIYTSIHIYIYTYIHTYKYTYIYTHSHVHRHR